MSGSSPSVEDLRVRVIAHLIAEEARRWRDRRISSDYQHDLCDQQDVAAVVGDPPTRRAVVAACRANALEVRAMWRSLKGSLRRASPREMQTFSARDGRTK